MSQELKDCLDEIMGILISKLDDLESLDTTGVTSEIVGLMSNIIRLISTLK